jgi:hypothetical protein
MQCRLCGRDQPSAEVRRTTLGFVCKEKQLCARRVRTQKNEARAANLTASERRRIEQAFESLDRVRKTTKGAWDAAPLARVAAARVELALYLNRREEP